VTLKQSSRRLRLPPAVQAAVARRPAIFLSDQFGGTSVDAVLNVEEQHTEGRDLGVWASLAPTLNLALDECFPLKKQAPQTQPNGPHTFCVGPGADSSRRRAATEVAADQAD
jgi:hypothetical protein